MHRYVKFTLSLQNLSSVPHFVQHFAFYKVCRHLTLHNPENFVFFLQERPLIVQTSKQTIKYSSDHTFSPRRRSFFLLCTMVCTIFRPQNPTIVNKSLTKISIVMKPVLS